MFLQLKCKASLSLSVGDHLTCFAAVNCKIVFLSDHSFGQPCSTTNHLAGIRCQFCWGDGGGGGAVRTAHFGGLGNCFDQDRWGLVEAVPPWQPGSCRGGRDGERERLSYVIMAQSRLYVIHSVMTEIWGKQTCCCSWGGYFTLHKKKKTLLRTGLVPELKH